ncbi:MAG: hypothetical protein ACRYFX_01265 [Janthinobacterium lividum]
MALLALCCLASAGAQAQTPIHPVTPPNSLSIVATLPTICQGGSTVLSIGGNGALQANTTYTWSPNQDISSTGGTSVVVNPTQTTTYTLTALTNDGNAGTVRTATFTVNVQADCCQTTTLSSQGVTPVELTAATYTSNPFAGYDPGTYFHYAGSTLTLSGNTTYSLPVGGVLLLESNAEVVVSSAARFELNAGTITAACNEMWKGITLKNTAASIDFHGVNVHTIGQARKPVAMRNHLMHSRQGLVLEDGSRDPEFQLNYTDFWHNYRSLDIHRRQGGGTGTNVDNRILTCVFTSSPALMKSPYQASGSTYYYSDYHLRVAGRVDHALAMGLQLCDFDNAVGHILCDSTRTALAPASCTFRRFYKAGIYYAGGGLPSYGTPTNTLTVSSYLVEYPTSFTFPAYPLPATPQLAAANATYSDLPGVAGIATQDELVNVQAATFQQSLAADYNYTGTTFLVGPYTHAGIRTAALGTIGGCSFLDLETGIAHALPAGDMSAQLSQNFFASCGRGYQVTNPANNAISPANAGTVVSSPLK